LRKGISILLNVHFMKRIIGIFSLTAIILLSSFHTLEVRNFRVKKIVIDAGHGGHDPGTHGVISKEKDLALKIALKLGDYIEKNLSDVEVIYTRDNDTFVELHGRAYMANKNGADLFISIHCNAFPPNPDVKGTETYVMGLSKASRNLEVAKLENSVIFLEENYEEQYQGFDPNSPESLILLSLEQTAFQENSLLLAANIENQFKNRVGRHSRGVKMAPFWVLWDTSMPSVLVETGYLSNKKEEKDLNDPLLQDYLASAIFRAFRNYKNEIDSRN
jgi:N-acetylmuramoyl-L-alanine amidase